MRLLIFTQTVDRTDSSLGYYHAWLAELAKHFEQLTVVALRVGVYDLPAQVTVVPLRPWGYRARFRTALRVLQLTWRYRKDYDAVFIHMNQEYLLIAGWLFRILGKPVFFWRNHYEGSLVTDSAALFCDKIFYTSKSSYTAKYAKAVQMPVGVDVGSCHLDEPIERPPRSVLFLGRFDRSKRPDLVAEALGILAKEGSVFTATFVGGPSDSASSFPEEVKARVAELGIADWVTFVGPVPNTETYRYYRSHAVYVNCGKSGMLDKSLFKSIACGCLPIFTSADMSEIVGPEYSYRDGDAADLAQHLEKALALSPESRTALVRAYEQQAIEAHTLPVLARRLYEEMHL
ncbi:MAG: glycosyltransferase [Candidatus Paceibacterota bacterium]|jgi:glycosyltransferase involved in cell wall biosynthesis